MTTLPNSFRFNTAGLREDDASQAWCNVMERMFCVDRSTTTGRMPLGGVSATVVGDIFANKSTFNAQTLKRDRRKIDATPDHLVLQYYQSGGYSGEIDGDAIRIGRGQVAICDLRKLLEVEARPSHTIGVTIPRHLLDDIALTKLPLRLAPSLERILAASISRLHRDIPKTGDTEISKATNVLLDTVRRLFDPSASAHSFDACAFDDDNYDLAELIIADLLASPDLCPTTIADQIHVSRATLYRIFARAGGVMNRVWTMRLESVRRALEQPSDTRTLSRLAVENGFKSSAHLSRSFRTNYGMTPSDWRARIVIGLQTDWHEETIRLNRCWQFLGQ